MRIRASWNLLAILTMLAPALARADTAWVASVDNQAGFDQTVVFDIEAAIVAELETEPGMLAITYTQLGNATQLQECIAEKGEEALAACLGKTVTGPKRPGLLVVSRLASGPGGAWLSVKIVSIGEARIIGRSRIKQVTPEDAAARAREAVAEARGRRAELAPETGAEAGTPGTTVVDGVALAPAGVVVRSENGTLKPAGQVLKPEREVLEVAAAGGGVPVKPAGAVIQPEPSDTRPASGSIIDPEPSDLKPADGAVIEPRRETIPAGEQETGRRWPDPATQPGAPAAATASRSDLEWYSGWAALGVGLALGGTAVAFANQLRDEDGDERDAHLLTSQVTGGLAVAAAVTGVVLLLLSAEEQPPATAGVVPVRGGAALGLAARF